MTIFAVSPLRNSSLWSSGSQAINRSVAPPLTSKKNIHTLYPWSFVSVVVVFLLLLLLHR